MKTALWRTAAAVIAALAMGAAHSYPGLAWLALVAIAPLCFALRGETYLADWGTLALFQGIFTALTVHWISAAAPGFVWLAVAAVAYQMMLAVIPAAGVWISGQRSGPQWLIVLPALWALTELASRRMLFGVSWALLGLPLADYPVTGQIASIAGPEALTFVVVAVNVAITALFRKSAGNTRWVLAGQGAILAVAMIAFGHLHVGGEAERVTTKIAVVQPMISQQTRWDRLENRPPLLKRMTRLIDRAAAQSPRLIVLPEGSLPGLVRYEADLASFATDAVRRSGVPVLFGTIDRDSEGRVYNAALRIGTDGSENEYRKQRLVPFAERTPWPFHVAPPEGWVEFTPGAERTLMPLNAGVSYSVATCLEDTYPDLARESAMNGADFLVALVNTESFRETNQPLTHLRRARLTAIAAGLPMVRAANSGISCSIDAHGRVLRAVPVNREEALALPVAAGSIGTFYRIVGDTGAATLLLLVLGCQTVWLRRKPRMQVKMEFNRLRRRTTSRTERPLTFR